MIMKHRTWFRTLAYSLILLTLIASAASTVSAQNNQPTSGGAFAQAVARSTGKLSFRLAMLANSPSLQTASIQEQSRILSLPSKGAGSLMRSAQGSLLVDIRMSDLSKAQLDTLRAAGVQIVHVSDQYKTVTVYSPVTLLSKVASLAAVESIREEMTPITNDASTAPGQAKPVTATGGSPCPQGIAVSEGDAQLRANLARSEYDLDGSRVSVGLQSDSFDTDSTAATHASDDVASGDLPGAANPCGYTTPVNVLSDYVGGADEGRGMAQIVHDVAPGASLSFATAFDGLFSFADNIRALRAAGADIIADDVTYFDEPMFQEGPVNVAISDVVKSGATYFTSAGNENITLGGKSVASYEAPAYRPMACPVALTGYPFYEKDCHNFNTSGAANNGSDFTLESGGQIIIDLQWAEPWYGVKTDLDIFVLDESNQPVAGSIFDNYNLQEPFEFMFLVNNDSSAHNYHIVLARYAGRNIPRLKYVFIETYGLSSVQYNTSRGGDIVGPTIFGHSATSAGFSVAAVRYSDSTRPEYFSSHGPAAHYFGPVLNDFPAPAIAKQVLNQPDFAATDGGCSTFFYSYYHGCYRFFGTSAAAPHAAAVTALLKEGENYLGWSFTRPIVFTALTQSAQFVSNGTPDAVGAGLLDAFSAVSRIPGFTPGIFKKSAPANGKAKMGVNPKLTWGVSKGAISYEYCLTTNAPTNRLLTCDTGWKDSQGMTSVALSNLNHATTYYWQVRAYDPYDTIYADNADWWSFTTK